MIQEKKKEMNLLSLPRVQKFKKAMGKDGISQDGSRWSCSLKKRREILFLKHREESHAVGRKGVLMLPSAFVQFVL